MASLVNGEPLRVLLVSPHAKQREEAGEALQAAGEHRFYWVSQPDLALTRAAGLAPHIILVDDDLAGADPATLIRQLAQGLPESAVLLLAAPDALSVAQAAVLAGARAFMLKPVKGEDLTSTLRQVLARRGQAGPQPSVREASTGRVIVFCGPKGGTGRTTLAINTAVSLREATREPVVVVDADYAAPAIDVALNLRGQRDIRDLLPKLNQLDADLISTVLATHSSGVRLLLAPPPDQLDYPPTLPQVQQVTSWLKRLFPWVLVDLGLPLDEASYAFLDAADRVIMSVLPEMVGMRNAKVMLAEFDARNYPPGKVWPVLNREGLPGGVSRPEIATYLGRDLHFAVPNDQDLATESINRGVPVVSAHRLRPLAGAYRKLAGMLVDDRKAMAAQPFGVDAPAPAVRLREAGVAPAAALPKATVAPAVAAAPPSQRPGPAAARAAAPVTAPPQPAEGPAVTRPAIPAGRVAATAATRPAARTSRPVRPAASGLDRVRGIWATPQARRILLSAVIVLVLLALLAFIVPRVVSGLMGGTGAAPLGGIVAGVLGVAAGPPWSG